MPGFELIGEEERDAVNDVFERGGILLRYGFDQKRRQIFRVSDFEKRFSQFVGATFAQAVSSGTAALHCALKALNIRPGDEVITQSHTFVATVEAIIESGAVPVITDIDETLNMDPVDLEKKITSRTRAIIPVHMLGVPCNMDAIIKIAAHHNIPVLEDACQALGANYHGKSVGTLGDVGVFSFDFGKTLTTGEGGMVVSNKEEIYQRAREYSDHGHECNPNIPRGEDTRTMWGLNYRMMELAGAIGCVQLAKLSQSIMRQKQNKKQVKDNLALFQGVKFRSLSDADGDAGDTLVFIFDTQELAKKFVKHFRQQGFGTKNLPDAVNWHFAGTWDHMLACFEQYRGKELMRIWDKSTDILSRSVAIPVMIKMDDNQIEKLISTINTIFHEIQ